MKNGRVVRDGQAREPAVMVDLLKEEIKNSTIVTKEALAGTIRKTMMVMRDHDLNLI
jgi:hypothetical protein